MIAKHAPLAFPDPNLPFHIHTDASDKQLGAVMKQNGLPIAFFSRKLTAAQIKHPTVDEEMLCVVEVPKECRVISWGASINICTDHINLTRNAITSQRIMTWRMLCKEFLPAFHCVKGPDDIKADALSRLPFEEKKGVLSPSNSTDKSNDQEPAENINHAADNKLNLSINDNVVNVINVPSSSNLFIDCPSDLPDFLVAFPQLEKAQQMDDETQSKEHCIAKRFHEHNLKCCVKNGMTKIVLPNSLVNSTVKWCHHTMGHAGADQLLQTISQFLHSPDLCDEVGEFVKTCDACQRCENPGPGAGHVPAQIKSMVLFEQIATDTTGPWKISINDDEEIHINAHSVIDTCSNLLELKQASQQNPEGSESVQVLEDVWLLRHPKPVKIAFDQGTECENIDFESFLVSQGIKGVPCTAKNLQSNATLERAHNAIKTSLRAETETIANEEDANKIVDRLLASAQHAVCVWIHKTHGLLPGSAVFKRDMPLPIPIIVNLQTLQNERQILIDKNNLKENARRKQHDCNVGDQILIIAFKPNALKDRAKGPHTISQVHTDGTVSYMLNEEVIDQINI